MTWAALVAQAVASGSSETAAIKTVAADYGVDAEWLYRKLKGRKPRW